MDSDGSDRDNKGEIGHLPSMMLNAHAELMGTVDDRNNFDYELPHPH